MTARPAPSDDEIRSWGARCSVEQAARALGMGHNQARAAIRRGDFPLPWFKVGRQYVIPTAPLRALLRIDQSPVNGESRDAHPASATSSGGRTDDDSSDHIAQSRPA